MIPSEGLEGFTGYRKAREPFAPVPRGSVPWLTPLLAAVVALALGLSGGYAIFATPDDDGSGGDGGYGSEGDGPAVALVAPADGASGAPPTLYWHGSGDGVLSYTLRYTPDGGDPVTVSRLTDGSYQLPALTPGDYTWTVEVSDGTSTSTSETWSFTIVAPTNHAPAVALLGPADGAEFEGAPALYWTASDADGDDLYAVVTIINTAADDAVTAGGVAPGYRPAALAPGDYEWEVSVSDSTDEQVSSSWEFTILPSVDDPPVIELLFPENGQSLLEATLVWASHDPEGEPVLYELYLDDTDATTLVTTTSDNRYTPDGLELETTYYWKVVASDGTQQAASPVWSFTLAPLPETSLVPEADFGAAEALTGDSPLSEAMEPVDRSAEMEAASSNIENSNIDDSGANLVEVSDDAPAAPGTDLDTGDDPDLAQADLNEPRHGPAAAGDGEAQSDNLANGLEHFPTDDSAALDRDYGKDFGEMFADPFADGDGRSNLLTVRVITSGDVYDNNSDGNPEFVRFFTVGYGALGDADSPEYESLYISEFRAYDNNSDGNVSWLALSEFGFESYDGDHDGQPEYAAVHIRWARALDSDSDGNPEHVHGFEADYVMVDADGDNASEFQAGHFAAIELWDNNSDGQPESLGMGEWSFLRADADNDTHAELVATWASHLQMWDNNSDGHPESAKYVEFGYGAVDNNSDGDPELEIVVFKAFNVRDPNSTGHAESVEAGEAFFLHATDEGNFTLAAATQLTVTDNNSDGSAEVLEFVEWKYVGADADNDGNREFEAVEFSSFLVYDNCSNGNPTFVKAAKLQAWMWDEDDDGDNETGRVVLEVYLREDSDGDGVPEEEHYWRWDSDDD